MSLSAYLAAVVDRLRTVFGERLNGVYPAGSLAFDAYRPGRSDVDLIAVASSPSPGEVAAVVSALSHAALPCPAAGLEFVLYDRATLADVGIGAGFALNLNTGRELTAKAETSAGGGLTFWYPIDRDMVGQQDRVLTGPSFTTLTTRLPRATLLPVVAASVAAQLAGLTDHGDNAVLNGCRALRYRSEGIWSAKPAAASWALGAVPAHATVITAALASHARDRTAGRHVDRAAARAFLTDVLHRVSGGVARGL